MNKYGEESINLNNSLSTDAVSSDTSRISDNITDIDGIFGCAFTPSQDVA